MKRNQDNEIVLKVIQDSITSLLGPLGFRRRGKKWNKETEETVVQIWLQSARFSDLPSFYVNLSAMIKLLPDRHYPGHQHHVGMRLDDIVGRQVTCLTDMRREHLDTQICEFLDLMKQHAIPVVTLYGSIEGLRRFALQFPRHCFAARSDARDLIGVDK